MGAIVFDLDGTLVDSAEQIMAAANAVLADEGAEPLTLDQTKGFIGNGARVFVARMIAARGLAEADLPRLHAAFVAGAEEDTAGAALFPGAARALRDLAAQGHALGICTNKPAGPTRALLAALGIAPLFRAVIGGDSLPVLKPDPAPLHAAFAPLGPPLLFVGDSEVDFATAQAAGVPFALHTRGYRRAGIADFPGAWCFDDWAALPAHAATLI